MGKLQNQSGFSAVEGLLILVVVGILGFTGWYVLQAKSNADKSLNSNHSTAPIIKKKAAADTKTPIPDVTLADPEGWKKCEHKVEKVSFSYPATWTGDCKFVDTNGDGKKYGLDLTTPAKFPESFQVGYASGSTTGRYTGSDKPDTVLGVVPLSTTFKDKKLYAVMFADEWTDHGQVIGMVLSDTKYSEGQSVAVTAVHSITRPGTFIVLSARLGDHAHEGQNFTVSDYKASSDYQDVIRFFESLKVK